MKVIEPHIKPISSFIPYFIFFSFFGLIARKKAMQSPVQVPNYGNSFEFCPTSGCVEAFQLVLFILKLAKNIGVMFYVFQGRMVCPSNENQL